MTLPDDSADDEYVPSALQEGDKIRLMAEDGVDCPLWAGGLLFSDELEFVESGAPADLARDLAVWAEERDRNGRTGPSDAEALKLLDRLSEAFDHRYRFVFKP